MSARTRPTPALRFPTARNDKFDAADPAVSFTPSTRGGFIASTIVDGTRVASSAYSSRAAALADLNILVARLRPAGGGR